MRKAEHEMVVCNACRYCEAYCPVFQAMEQRVTFSPGDLTYLANLCHNCGECLYACQYAPPHEFGIDVPHTLSKVRVETYQAAVWPSFAAFAFRRPWLTTIGALLVSANVIIVAAAWNVRSFDDVAWRAWFLDLLNHPANFYGVISHRAMVALFGAAGLFAVLALAIGHRRFNAAVRTAVDPGSRIPVPGRIADPGRRALTDVLTLKHLHATGEDCVDAEETRRPWRRWLHHCTLYGFALCFASTTVAAIYHLVFGWIAPYDYASLPVVLGTLGGVGLLIGPAGLFLVDRARDPALTDASERWLGGPFLAMLFLTSLTGLILMVLRDRWYMPALLSVHLAIVLALFVTLPYGKFVHGIYRAAALGKFRREEHEGL
jgi:citrate/tricarballylate utilization protein